MDSSTTSRAMSDSLKSLDEIRYALDQAAIVAATDHRGLITYVNDKFCEISQYSREELIGHDHRIVNSEFHPKEFMRDLWHTIARGKVWRGEIRNRAKDGSFYWVDTTIVPFLDGNKPRQYLAIRYDITNRKQVEAQLREQAALARLGQLAAVVAHEVRNPLAGLRATLQVIGGRVPETRDRTAIAAMIQRIDGLNDKVEDLLLYARPRPPRLQPVDVKALIREVANTAQIGAGRTGAIPVSGDDVKVTADPEMLRAALLNLTMNACQAAPSNDVEVRVAAKDGTCQVAVCDRGPGIPAEIRERVLEPFFTTRVNGTGLGLAIVRRLVELQDGSVQLRERPGGGTIAEITLPRTAGSRWARTPEGARLRASSLAGNGLAGAEHVCRRFCRFVGRPRWQRQHQTRRQAQQAVRHRSHARPELRRAVQAHDDNARMPVAHDFRGLLRGIAEHNQCLRSKAGRNRRHQFVEVLLGQRPAAGIQSCQVQARSQTALHRLDHVEEHEREMQRLRQTRGQVRLVERRR
jgi:PAS domain S-box-containing protein